mgnify:CR=1 FL=1
MVKKSSEKVNKMGSSVMVKDVSMLTMVFTWESGSSVIVKDGRQYVDHGIQDASNGECTKQRGFVDMQAHC